MKKTFIILLCGLMSSLAFAQWSPTSLQDGKVRPTSESQKHYSLDIKALRAKLSSAVETGRGSVPVEINIPTLNGKIERFAVYSSPVVVKSLADRLELGSYVGVGVDDPTAYIRFSIAPNDFQSMMLKNGVYEFIEPQNADKSVYGVHPKTNKINSDKAFVCSTNEPAMNKEQMEKLYSAGKNFTNNPADFSKSSDRKYRTMRLAMSVTAEYTQYFGGVSQALTAINATLTRVNFVFEKDFALKLILQDLPQLIYTDPETDPYSSLGKWNFELQKTLTAVVGESNYDIGHLFGASGGGGSAGCIGCVCISPELDVNGIPMENGKGSGITSPANAIPQGDSFDIDYVAHEMGHQLGANHTFAHKLESRLQNVEPGSGSTIMGYAGITADNVQMNSDPYFHINSIIQVQNNLVSKQCDIETAMINNPPVITAMPQITIPKGTAFSLTAQATDVENNPLTYTWEQTDNATDIITKSNLGKTNNGASFRSVMGTANPVRYFPKFETVLGGLVRNPDGWESVSMVARTSNFKVTVRDNNPDPMQQQTETALQSVVTSPNGPFKITSLTLYNNEVRPLTWDVAGTNAAPFNATNVKIDYTVDNGTTWTVLANSTPNDGTEPFDVTPFATGTIVKVRISAIGNVFYTIDPVKISSVIACDGTAPSLLEVSSVDVNTAVVTWDAVSNATYILRYKKSTDVSFTDIPVATNSYTLDYLSEGTQYNVQVAAVCLGSTGTFTPSTTFQTIVRPYCTAAAANTTFEIINNVTFSNINNSSITKDGYEDFTAIVGNVFRGTSYNFSATADKSYSSDELRVWIDFNNNRLFEDETELVLITAKKAAPWEGMITIPADAKIGLTRMRVRMQDTNYGMNNAACGTNSYGQVEDYTINIEAAAATDNVHKSKIQIYPNPVEDILNVSLVSKNATYVIYSISGQLISKGKIIDNKIAVSELNRGIYLIAIENDGDVSQMKFIKK
ncbi:T9SS type A sorting domain-containing protein [Chryseobacterium sp. SNU WT5]|uniref:reprolysin-like metallopeptidase n=1 Tax=Chryseobacterium sp. SNU WT5 TaxID=2594269 RepID=UPI00117D29A4|nr:M12 family metallo-peptidase [Chryseobacterium sp. SNU WT5]QDP84791.1 T9SS type A sorting domain-containing protein [Chryseobacterium sp. SNU WT5]